jgi:hypothetical protein
MLSILSDIDWDDVMRTVPGSSCSKPARAAGKEKKETTIVGLSENYFFFLSEPIPTICLDLISSSPSFALNYVSSYVTSILMPATAHK